MRASAPDVIKAVCWWTGVTHLELIRRHNRQAPVVKARRLIVYVLHEYAGMSYPEIAAALQTKAHSHLVDAKRLLSQELLAVALKAEHECQHGNGKLDETMAALAEALKHDDPKLRSA